MKEQKLNIRVFIVDDDAVLRSAIVQAFELENFDVESVAFAQDLLARIDKEFAGVIVTDVRMPTLDGITFFRAVKAIDPEIPVIFLTGHADVPMVLSTLHEGAFDFFSKPVDTDHLLATTNRAISSRKLVLENRQLRQKAEKIIHGSNLLGESPIMQKLRATIKQVAQSDVDVMIEGETGTGKQVVAQMLYQLSNRTSHKFINVNCAAMPDNLAEEELFGMQNHSGAYDRNERIGKIEASHRGILFLDEIDSLSLNLQGQLVPILESRELPSTGITGNKSLNLKIISSSQKDLSAAVENGEFRADLYYLLNTVRLRLPTLNSRREDIPLLFAHLLTEATEKFSKKLPKISSKAQQRLLEYEWPGNLRELKNFADSLVLGIEDSHVKNSIEQLTLPERVERFESNTIISSLEYTKGDVRSTLELLGIPRKTFYDKVARHKININKFRN